MELLTSALNILYQQSHNHCRRQLVELLPPLVEKGIRCVVLLLFLL